MDLINNIAKLILKKVKDYYYNRTDNKKAKGIRKKIELEKGKLSKKNKKLCINYAKNVLGHKKYAQWILTYATYAGGFKYGWIPDNYYAEKVISRIQGDYGQICNRSPIIDILLGSYDSLDICYYVNNRFYSKNFQQVNQNNILETLFKSNQKIVYKIENSIQGKGIYFFNKNSFDLNKIKKLGNGVFQKAIKQHPFFDQFNDTAVTTLRLSSFVDKNGSVNVYGGFLKFGRQNDKHVKSTSAIKIPVNVYDGTLYEYAILPDFTLVKNLPDNDIKFNGLKLPFFNNCIEEVKKLHRRIPFLTCIGWDLTVDNMNKVAIIELNGMHDGIWVHEIFRGPCFNGLGWENLNKS